MECKCIECQWCEGRATFYKLNGKLSFSHPCDDLADIVPCEECGGSGIEAVCDECQDAFESDHDLAN